MKGSMKLRVEGMHCPACTALVEREFAKVPGTKKVKASLSDGSAEIEWEGESAPDAAAYDERVGRFGYKAAAEDGSASPAVGRIRSLRNEAGSWTLAVFVSAAFVAAYYGIQASGIAGEAASRSDATIAAALLSGLAASVSSCLALVGSLVLALGAYSGDGEGRFAPIRRNLLFQAGRLCSFAVLGGVLGLAGESLKFSDRAAAVAAVAGGAVALVLGVGLLIPRASGLGVIRLPRAFSRFLDAVAASKNPLAPILLGSATFFLPCGFALSMQALALASGSFMGGALIMGAFAVGTAPVLTAAGLAGSWTKRKGRTLSRAAGLTIVAFSLFAVAGGLSLFGFGGDRGLRTAAGGSPSVTAESGAPAAQASAERVLAGETQRVVMRVGSYSFEPAEIRVKAGVPVEWVIVGENPSGCTNRIVVPSADLSIPVKKGSSQTVKFTVERAGVIPFSCWMGMVHGKIVVEG
jgi:sulfite exporter TauE/SafE/copper chaperone CopZ